ncbi:MATE family efflux transporter [Photobacterium profundum]|uniref:MATE family efflux transporter n=1 Tax=Photobacterium profundum TaxID=74109 RepID=UPI003D0C2C05
MTAILRNIYQHTQGHFLRSLITIAIPITLQSILFSSKGLIDVLMLSQLDEIDVAAIGVASRAIFVTTIMLGGITTGGALLTAQYWGAKDTQGVRESTALTWLATMGTALITVCVFLVFPSHIMGLATDSALVNQRGSEYLMITGFSMIAVACVGSMSAGLRSMHQPGISTLFSTLGIIANIFLNWVLIFGHFGLPALGIKGAAIATLLSSVIEVIALYGYLYGKQHLLAFSFLDIKRIINKDKFTLFFSLSLPTTFNFLAWAAGLFTYTAIMGQTGVQGLAALSVITPIESLSLSLLVGIANAAGVLVGNQIGAKNYDAVYYQAISFAYISFLVSLLVAMGLYNLKAPLLDMFTALTPGTRQLAESFIIILCFGVVLRSVPTTLVVGVLRAGGDVKFCLYQDMLTQWAFGIPLTALGAIWLNFPPEWVYALFLLEAVFKWFACIHRLRSRKWIKNLIAA